MMLYARLHTKTLGVGKVILHLSFFLELISPRTRAWLPALYLHVLGAGCLPLLQQLRDWAGSSRAIHRNNPDGKGMLSFFVCTSYPVL